jgi:hypothetical protein
VTAAEQILSAFEKTGAITEALRTAPKITPRFAGPPDDVVGQAEALFRQQRSLTLAQLIEVPPGAGRQPDRGRRSRDAPRRRLEPRRRRLDGPPAGRRVPDRRRPVGAPRPGRCQGRPRRRAGEGAGKAPARGHQARRVRRPHRSQPPARLRAPGARLRLAVRLAQREVRADRARAQGGPRAGEGVRLHRRGGPAGHARDALVPRLLQPRPRAVQGPEGRRPARVPRGAGREEEEPRRAALRAGEEVVRHVPRVGRRRRDPARAAHARVQPRRPRPHRPDVLAGAAGDRPLGPAVAQIKASPDRGRPANPRPARGPARVRRRRREDVHRARGHRPRAPGGLGAAPGDPRARVARVEVARRHPLHAARLPRRGDRLEAQADLPRRSAGTSSPRRRTRRRSGRRSGPCSRPARSTSWSSATTRSRGRG